jgi:hypothetical protein
MQIPRVPRFFSVRNVEIVSNVLVLLVRVGSVVQKWFSGRMNDIV